MQAAGLQPGSPFYVAAVRVCARAGNVCRAEHWMKRMEAEGVEVDASSYSTVIRACAEGSYLARAGYWLDRMRKAHMKPSVGTVRALLYALRQHGGDLGSLAANIEAAHYDISGAFDTVIKVCATL